MNSTFHDAFETEEKNFKERMEHGFENPSLPRDVLPPQFVM
jgi:hypothetical protein